MTPYWCVVAIYLIGLADMPYGYYMITRLVTTGVAIWLIWRLYILGQGGSELLWFLGGIAVLYNPVFPVYLYSKPLWIMINVVTLGVFWYAVNMGRRIALLHQSTLKRTDSNGL